MVMRFIIAEQYAKLPVLATPDTCTGKTYIVTGANSGLGLETARHLVRCSASRVILAVRNVAAGEAAKQDIERTTGRKEVAQVWKLDLASQASIKEFASKVVKELERVDGLIENAGVLVDKWSTCEGNMETTMTVNVINTMLLAHLLLPKLIASAKHYNITPRLVFVVSGLGFTTPAKKELDKGGKHNIFQNLNNPNEQLIDERYSLSKLVLMYAVRSLSAAYPVSETKVIINMVSPGICSTGLARDTRAFMRAVQGIIRAVWARSAEEGSRTILHAVVSDESSHGKHLSGCKIKENWIPPWMTDNEGQQAQTQIWEELQNLMDKCVSLPLTALST